MKRTVSQLGLVALLATLAGGALARTAGETAVAGIGERLRANDCPGAIKALNASLPAGHPEVALLAGTMFEAGFCVNKSWNKAMGFYTQAHEGGLREGALRLPAGFADRANGPDTAAALWWAKRAGLKAGYCTDWLPDTEDPDKFVTALRQWMLKDREVCNFVIGEMAYLAADVRYPIAGISYEISGTIEVVFTPALSRFHTTPVDVTWTGGKHLSEVMARSMGQATLRYRNPGGIAESWKIPFVLDIDTDKRRWW